jgi:succinate dehydrogenase hydrophobic anchor subunit
VTLQRFTAVALAVLTVLALGGIVATLLAPVHNGHCRSCGTPTPVSPGLTP